MPDYEAIRRKWAQDERPEWLDDRLQSKAEEQESANGDS
jgi:hypothetical protein